MALREHRAALEESLERVGVSLDEWFLGSLPLAYLLRKFAWLPEGSPIWQALEVPQAWTLTERRLTELLNLGLIQDWHFVSANSDPEGKVPPEPTLAPFPEELRQEREAREKRNAPRVENPVERRIRLREEAAKAAVEAQGA